MPIYFFHIFFDICIYWTPVCDEDTFLPCKTLNQEQNWIVRKVLDLLKGTCRSMDGWNVFECHPSKLVLMKAADKLGEKHVLLSKKKETWHGDPVLLNPWVYTGLSWKKRKASSSFSLFWWNHPFFAPTSHFNKVGHISVSPKLSLLL